MLLNQKQTSIAYRCPHCGDTVTSMVGVFGLSADMLRLKCPCGGSELTLVYTADKKVRLTVPCFLCPNPHSFTVSSSVFFDKDAFAFACPYSGVDIAFTGRPDKVSEMIRQSNEALSEMLGERSLDDVRRARGSGDMFSDPQILDIILYVIRDLNEAGGISCRCADGGDYDVEIGEDAVTVRCKKCGAATTVPAGSTLEANAFLHCDHIELT